MADLPGHRFLRPRFHTHRASIARLAHVQQVAKKASAATGIEAEELTKAAPVEELKLGLRVRQIIKCLQHQHLEQ